ncbi:MAG TPA: hypothetical protein VGQ03_04785 [Nitrososphaera sp.]|nr:hypothetical protein [Nitrososphaera sp.]
MTKYEELAARRFRQYKWEKRKSAFDQTLISLAFMLFRRSVPIFQQTGLTRRRSVERVDVE